MNKGRDYHRAFNAEYLKRLQPKLVYGGNQIPFKHRNVLKEIEDLVIAGAKDIQDIGEVTVQSMLALSQRSTNRRAQLTFLRLSRMLKKRQEGDNV